MLYASGLFDFECICVSTGEQPRDCGQKTLSSWFMTACGQLAVVREWCFVARLSGLVSAPHEEIAPPCGCLGTCVGL